MLGCIEGVLHVPASEDGLMWRLSRSRGTCATGTVRSLNPRSLASVLQPHQHADILACAGADAGGALCEGGGGACADRGHHQRAGPARVLRPRHVPRSAAGHRGRGPRAHHRQHLGHRWVPRPDKTGVSSVSSDIPSARCQASKPAEVSVLSLGCAFREKSIDASCLKRLS